ncbi:hypothetical protein A2645_00515, partial [Candidatus Nomurabacteria bacterium RIFCSPHIGHO2_01_FULL_39_9]
DPLLASYFSDIEKYPRLEREEEIYFIQKAQKGDRKAREIVFQGNCRFVISVAKMYQNNGLPIVDLINEGNIGLLSAIERYDPAREAKFISYAVWWIRQGILDALMKQNYTIALPLNYYSTNLHIERFEEKFFGENDRQPTSLEIAEKFGMSTSEIEGRFTMRTISKTEWLSRPTEIVLRDEGNMYFEEITYLSCGIEAEEKSDELLLLESCRTDILRVISNLTDREREVLKLFFSLNGNPNKEGSSLEEIGDRVGLTKERVRQIKEKAIRRIRLRSSVFKGEILRRYLGNLTSIGFTI